MALYLNNFGLVKARPEASYGTHPNNGEDAGLVTLADYDAEIVEEFTATEEYEPIQRKGKSKERPGWALQTGTRTPRFTCMTELRPMRMYKFTMNAIYEIEDPTALGNEFYTGAGLSGADPIDRHALPGGAIWLMAAGFKQDVTAGVEGDDTLGAEIDAENVFVPDVFAAPSITIENYTRRYSQSGEEYIKQTMSGARADGTLRVRAGERLMLELTGGAKSLTTTDYLPVDAGSNPRELSPNWNDDGREPDTAFNPAVDMFVDADLRNSFVGLGATVSLSYTDSAGTPYSLTNAGNPAGLIELEIQFNNGLTYPRVMEEDGSVSEVILAPVDNMGFRLRNEAAEMNQWDVYDLTSNKYPLTVSVQLADRETDRDYIQLDFTGYVGNAEFDEEDARLVWTCTGSVAYANQGQPFPGSPLLSIKWVTPYT